MNVPLLDLKAQYDTIRDEIEPVIRNVVESQMFILGESVATLEREIAEYVGVEHAVGCASGSDAILLALMALDIGPGDEVICPSYTFFATGGYVVRAGATPVFCDVDPVTYNIDVESVRAAAAKCTRLKAIMPVHLYGQAADMRAVQAVADELGVPVIEDAAQAIGTRDAEGRRVGSIGRLGCFSFFPTKNLGAFGDGGIVTTNDAELAQRLRRTRMHGMEPKYVHHEVGVNSRLDALQAAVLSVKLRHLDGWSAGRRANADVYDRCFSEAGGVSSQTPLEDGGYPIRFPHREDGDDRHIFNQYVIRVPASVRDDLRAHLGEQGIGSEIYYPIPLHLQTCFESLGYSAGDLPVSERLAKETIALPIYAELTDAQLEHVANTITTWIGAYATEVTV